MHIFEWSIHCNSISTDGSNNPPLGLIMVETSGCNNDFLSNIPIDWVLDSERRLTSCDRGTEHCPSVLPYLTMDGDKTLKTSNTLVSEHGLLCSIVASIKDEGELVLVGLSLCTCDKLAANNCNEPC